MATRLIMSMHLVLAACLVTDGWTADPIAEPQLEVRLSGKVSDERGQPVAGAAVSVVPGKYRLEAVSGRDGTYALTGKVSVTHLRNPDMTIRVEQKGSPAVFVAAPALIGHLDISISWKTPAGISDGDYELRLAPYPDDRSGALAPTFDDSKPTQMSFVKPLFDSFGYQCTFYVVTDSIDATQGSMTWGQLREAYGSGYEIGNHTSGHNLPNSPATAEVEAAAMAQIMGGYEAIARNVGHPPTTFAFPGGSENEFTQGLVKRTSMIGWRGDWPCVSGASEDLPLEGHLDCIRKAIAREKSWNGAVLDCYVFYMHDVPSDSRLAASLRGMLEFVQARDDAVWCAPYQAVTRYRTEREKTQLNITAKGPSSVTYSLPSMLDPKVYDLPLTTVIQVAVPVAKAWAFRQNDSRPLEVKLREGKIMVNAAPGDGAITVAWSSSKMESLPTVSLSGLETGGKFSMPAPIPLTATVGAGEVPVKSVVFYSGSTRIGEVAKPPFNYTWTTYAPGRHVLTAVAIDALGRRTVSQPAVVACYPKENLPPIATLQKIESRNYQAGQVIEMVVAATDPDDDVARVEYYDGETKIADGGPGALSWFGWNTATVGKHTVTARVYDERGAMTVTAPVTVTITP